jgi:hypothetical protein
LHTRIKLAVRDEKMREDEDEVGRLDAYVRNFEPV